MTDEEWREAVLTVTTDALNYAVVDARRLWGALNELAEARPDAHEIVYLRDWMTKAGAVFVQEIVKLQSSVMDK